MKQQHNAVAAGPVETTPGPALEIRTMEQRMFVCREDKALVALAIAEKRRRCIGEGFAYFVRGHGLVRVPTEERVA